MFLLIVFTIIVLVRNNLSTVGRVHDSLQRLGNANYSRNATINGFQI